MHDGYQLVYDMYSDDILTSPSNGLHFCVMQTRYDSTTPKKRISEVKPASYSSRDENVDPVTRNVAENRRHYQPYSQNPSISYSFSSSLSASLPFYPPYYHGTPGHSSSFRYYPNSASTSRLIPGPVLEYEPQHQRHDWLKSPEDFISEINPNDGR